jgi:BirA family biotin operon repressor/biotin-[acetyl-CoA-carboxylase] ligase
LAVAEALETFGFAPEIKWPNDVWLGGKKCCGILVEAPGEQVVVGVGLNVNGVEFPKGLEATSLEGEAGVPMNRDRVLEAVWRRLLDVMGRTPEAIAEEVWSRLAWREVDVEVRMDGELRRGRIRAFGANGELWVDSDGALLVISEAGSVRAAE